MAKRGTPQDVLRAALERKIKDLEHNQSMIGGVYLTLLPNCLTIKGICPRSATVVSLVSQPCSSRLECHRNHEAARAHLAAIGIQIMTESEWKSAAQKKEIMQGTAAVRKTKFYE